MSDQLPTLTAADWRDLEKAEYEDSLYSFIVGLDSDHPGAWHIVEPATELIEGWHLKIICAHLEAVSRGEITRIGISIPPGFMKSRLTSVFWPAWEWARRPHLRLITTSASEDFCRRDAEDMKLILESEWYQGYWPMTFPTDTILRFVNDKRGMRWGKSFTSLTGVRGNRLILDDVLTVEDGNSEIERMKVNRRFFEQATSRISSESDAIVIIMQRVHEADLIGEIMERQAKGHKLGFEFLNIPQEWEGEEYLSTAECMPVEYRRDPRTEIGQLLCPAYRSEKWRETEKATLGSYAWAAQHQQNPIPRGDGLFREADIKRYGPDDKPAQLNMYLTSDHALGGNKADANVAQVWGIDANNHIWLIDSYRDTASFRSLLGYTKTGNSYELHSKGIFPFIKKYKPICWFADADMIIKGQIENVRDDMIALNLFCRREIVNQGGKDKEFRAYPLQTLTENGMVHVPNNAMGEDFMTELLAFPAGRWRDQVDAATILPRVRTHAAYKAPVDERRARDGYSHAASEDADGSGNFF